MPHPSPAAETARPAAQELASLPTERVASCVLHPGAEGVPETAAAEYLGLPPSFGVRRCPTCGLRWLTPRPTPEGYERLYSRRFYFGDEVAERRNYRQVVGQRLWGFRRRLRRLEKTFAGEVGEGGPRGGLRLLDIGAATGDFVAEARARGHRAEGFEISAEARREARQRHGLEIAGGDLGDLSGPYDVVHLNHVLEHLPDPLAALRTAFRLTAPEGVLAVEVPQQFDNGVEWLLRLAGRSRHGQFDAHSLHHTYFFTPATLVATLEAGGFSVVESRTFHWGVTPPASTSPRNLLLGTYLWSLDKACRGGPVIEAYARRKEMEG